jgi:hypothetical protein
MKGSWVSKIPIISYVKEGYATQAYTFKEKCEAFLTTLFPAPISALSSTPPSTPLSTPPSTKPLTLRNSEPQKSTRLASKATDNLKWEWPELGNLEIA